MKFGIKELGLGQLQHRCLDDSVVLQLSLWQLRLNWVQIRNKSNKWKREKM